MKMLSVGKLIDSLGLFVWVKKDQIYQRFHVNQKDEVIAADELPVKNYQGYEHFVGVMGKFNPSTSFLVTPVEIGDDLKYEKLIDELNWFERLLRWEETLSPEERSSIKKLPKEIRHK